MNVLRSFTLRKFTLCKDINNKGLFTQFEARARVVDRSYAVYFTAR